MKIPATYARKFPGLIKKLKSQAGDYELPDGMDPIGLIILAFMEWNATSTMADDAYGRLMEDMVDFNELRITHPHELLERLPSNYPRAFERISRMHDTLNGIFRALHATSLEPLAAKSKKQLRSFLELLPGITPYVYTKVMLVGYGAHAVPIDEMLLELLKAEDYLPEDCGLSDGLGYLERHLRAEQSMEAHRVFRKWADDFGVVEVASGRKAPKAAAAGE
ncbi:MAG: hypothetical protein JJU36_11445 [Phycisphaeraceae bacterium]|nr:hypothetical protein [Phycisphaeraceae bacterium]